MFHVLYGLDSSCMFVQRCGISRDKHHLSEICVLAALIHVAVLIPATFDSYGCFAVNPTTLSFVAPFLNV